MEYLLLVGVVQALFTAVFLASKPRCPLSDGILAVWMVFIALPMVDGAAARLWPDVHIPILNADLIYPLTYGPFMWLYIGVLTGDVDRLMKRDLVHFVPFGLVSAAQLVSGWAPRPPDPEVAVFDTGTRLVGGLNLLVMLSYSVAVSWRLRQHSKEVVRHFSNLPKGVTLVWLCWLTAGFSAVSLLLFLASLLSIPDLLRVHLPAQVGIILALSFFGLRQTQVFDRSRQTIDTDQHDSNQSTEQSPQRLPEPSDRNAEPNEPKHSYSRSGLTDERAERIFVKLDAFMKTERPYLSADLTIAELAKRMAVSRHHLTEVISTRHNKSFYVFVNEYRVEAVKQAMSEPENSNATLLDLAYDAGFNSKSPFNAAFKQLTGMTPSQYRRQLA